MKAIWKYVTLVNGEFKSRFTLEIPKDAEILCIQRDEKTNIPCIWIMVDTEKEEEERDLELLATGYEIHCDAGVHRKYLGTYQYQNGEFVGHLFELTNTNSDENI